MRLRKSRKLSVEALAKKSRIPLPHLIGLEKGERDPHILELFQLATALAIVPSRFMQCVEWEERGA